MLWERPPATARRELRIAHRGDGGKPARAAFEKGPAARCVAILVSGPVLRDRLRSVNCRLKVAT